ncbi:PREDICTED: uncharacterized protein LOC109231637 [Nicotiana attenuata]|uniref:uncharacterized protein LOC109231637 n=1 Tax=Nicotiana attenuata TaxID=49451 RepID=UPI000904B7DF|nr:PREDICTED: uncharacterized protein LOC109231637 [Nicotiana attenuata]
MAHPTIKPPLPPEPPDKNEVMEVEAPQSSYKDMLLDNQQGNQETYYDNDNQLEQAKGKHIKGSIPLSPEEKDRIYASWRYSVIIKVFKKKMPYHLLRSKLVNLRNPSETLILFDLGWDFFIAKFSLEESMVKALHLGPWFVSGHFLSVRKWEPKFVPQEATLTSTAIWTRLPQLPTEFYDKAILEKVGWKLGKLLKIDQCTSSTLRGRYARICIQVPLETPVETSVIIGDHKQSVIYEGEGTLCTSCGRIGHTTLRCTYKMHYPPVNDTQDNSFHSDKSPEESEWKTVTFPRRRSQSSPKQPPTKENNPTNYQAKEVQVKTFEAGPGMVLDYLTCNPPKTQLKRLQPLPSLLQYPQCNEQDLRPKSNATQNPSTSRM